MQNIMGGQGSQSYNTGQQGYQAGLGAMAPTLQFLTQLTKGDQADVSQAIQPEANRIRDSFAAVRNMISAQPRGGGKAGQLAEAPFKEQQAITDLAAQERSQAAGQLGDLSSTLAGLGLRESGLGAQMMDEAAKNALARRGQNIEHSTSLETTWINALI